MNSSVEWGGPNQEYRYALWRVWDDSLPVIQWIGLNPSTADEFQDDPTIRKCIKFSKRWGFGGLVMTNLFAWRDTKPENMKKASSPIGELNDVYLLEASRIADVTVACWGNHGAYMDRYLRVKKLIPNLKALRINEATGQPAHPLYIPDVTDLMDFQ